MAVDVGSAVGYLDLDISGFLNGLKSAQSEAGKTGENIATQLGKKISGAGDKLTSVGSTLTKGVTVPLLAVGTAGMKVATDFESAMSEVRAITGATGDSVSGDFADLRNLAIDLGASTAFSAGEVANAMTEMAKAGWETGDILEGMSGVLDAAAASGENLGTVSTIIADAITGFGMEAGESARVADLLTEAANAGTIGISDLGETFKFVAPIAQSLNIEIEDATTAITALSKAGIKGSQAGTTLRTVMASMTGDIGLVGDAFGELTISTTNSDGTMREFNDVLADMRVAFSQMTEAERTANAEMIAGKTGMSGLLALMNMTQEEYDEISESMWNCSDVAKTTAEVMQDNLQSKIEQLGGALESLAIIMADNIIPALTTFVEWLTGLIEKFTQMDPVTQKVILAIVGIAIAAGPVITVIGKLVSGFGGIVSFVGKAASLFGGFANVASTAAAPIGSAGRSTSKMAAAAKNLVAAGAGILLAATGMALLAQSAIALADAGLPAVGCMVVMVGAMAALGAGALYITKTTASMRGLSKASANLVATGAGILLAAAGLALLANSAVQLANAGWPAIACMGGLVAALAALGAGAAAIAPALTAGSVGLIAFGGAIALVGVGILAATAGIALLATQLPTIAQYGSQAAGALVELGVGLTVLGGGALTAGAGLITMGAGLTVVAVGAAAAAVGITALGVSVLVLAAGAITLGAGLTLCGAGLTLMAATGQTAAAGMSSLAVAATAAFVPIVAGAASSAVLAAALLALAVPLAALTVEFGASAVACGLLAVAMESTAASVTTIESSAASAADSLAQMVTAVDVVKAGLDGFEALATAAVNGFVNAFVAGGPSAGAAALAMATGITTNVQTGLAPMPANVAATMAQVNAVTTAGMTQMSTTVITYSNMSALAVQMSMAQINVATTAGMVQMNATIHSGFSSAVSYIKSLAGQSYSWGADIMQGLINGINSKMGALQSAVNNAANIIYSNLHFSRPDTGPLRNYEEWMPHFMQGLAKGIDGNAYLVEDAIGGVTERMNVEPNYSIDGMFTAANNSDLENYNITLVNTLGIYKQLVEQMRLCSEYSMGISSVDNGLLKADRPKLDTDAEDERDSNSGNDKDGKPDQLVIPITIGEEQLETVVVDLLRREVRI